MTAKKLYWCKAAILARKEDFYRSLIPFVGKYPKEMIRDFFNYWSKVDKSCAKMRFEQQPTWEVAKRLATWASKDKGNHLSLAERKKFENYIIENLASVFK